MKHKQWTKRGAVVACIAVALLLAVPAGADVVWSSLFTNLSQNTSLTGEEFRVDVLWDSGTSDQVSFQIFNLGDGSPDTGVVQAVYWDETVPDILDFDSLFTQPANWAPPPTPPSFQGGVISPDAFVTQAGTDATDPAPTNGIDAGEDVTFVIGLNLGAGTWTAQDYEDALLGRLNASDLRVGIHVISIGENSDWFYAPPPAPVPVPAAAGIGLLGMGIVGVMRARKRRAV